MEILSLLFAAIVFAIIWHQYFQQTPMDVLGTLRSMCSDPRMDDFVAKLQKATSSEGAERVDAAVHKLRSLRIAFLVIDVQTDFVSGTLPIGAGDAGEDAAAIVPVINATMEQFKIVIFTKDWHPPDHISFLSAARLPDRSLSVSDTNKKLENFDNVTFTDPPRKQVLYPDHCVEESSGAEFTDGLNVPERAKIVLKGIESLVDSYSAFMDNEALKKSELDSELRSLGVDAVVGCGLAYDICVAETMKDAAKLGYYAAVVRDASAGLSIDGIGRAENDFADHRVAIIRSSDVASIVSGKNLPFEWIEKALQDIVSS